MNVLVTAIGSMSAECTVASLKAAGFGVVATDIYDACYHPVSADCLAFEKVVRAVPNAEAYCRAICGVAVRHNCSAVIPLTDPEVDALLPNRRLLEERGVALWLGSAEAISTARSCNEWSQRLCDVRSFKTIPTYLSYAELTGCYHGEFVAKRDKGRSSEGILFSHTNVFVPSPAYEQGYVFQPFVPGDVITVDFARHPDTKQLVVLPRQELMRTTNGAGTVVRILSPDCVAEAMAELCGALGLTGVMNCEFICTADGSLYLMDINPRFSAGISFSKLAGYDFVAADVACYLETSLPALSRIAVGSVCVKRFEDHIVPLNQEVSRPL